MKKGTLPDKNDFGGWIKRLEMHLDDNTGVKIKDRSVSYPDALKLLRLKLHHQFQYLKGKEGRIGKELVLEELEEWKGEVWKHFDLSQEIIKQLPKGEQAEATKDLKAFGGLVATGNFPKNYSSLIPVANMLIGFLRNEEWPKRSLLSERLRHYNHEVTSSTLADCLKLLQVADFVRDNQKG